MADPLAEPATLPLAPKVPGGHATVNAAHCRNCGASAPGAFCPQCGQETSIALPTARQFLKEAAGRYVALNGRLWRTLFALLFRPGFLTREYLAGRRRRYIRPARLFLVSSLAMFALFRMSVDVPTWLETDAMPPDAAKEVQSELRKELGNGKAVSGKAMITFDTDGNFLVDGPPGPLTDALKARVARFNALSRQDKIEQLTYGALRYGPYAMVVLLPAFALMLHLLYLGGRRRHPARPRRYAEHLVFASHDLSFLFLVAIVAVLVPGAWVDALLALWVVAYGLWAMKAVYGGSWIGVVARGACLAAGYLVMFVFVTVGLLLAAIVLR
jgi:hypothetical protein